MKRILLATKNSNDTTSFLRAWGAFTSKEMLEVATPIRRPLDPKWAFDWSYYLDVDCIYLHRPSTSEDFYIIQKAKQIGVPLWIDMDDDLEKLTPDNPVYAEYSKNEVKHCIQTAIREADILSVGGLTHQLRLIAEYEREVCLIPNALDDRLLNLKKPFKGSNKISWRGSESHRIDLFYYKQAIENISRNNPDREFSFFGLNPYMLDLKKMNWLEPQNLFDYYIALTSYNASIHIVPMIDTEFNRVKSNLAWTDATLAGSVVLGPDFPEYDRPGVFTYRSNDVENFARRFTTLLHGNADLKKYHDESWEWIRDNILMSKVNKKRIEIIKNL